MPPSVMLYPISRCPPGSTHLPPKEMLCGLWVPRNDWVSLFSRRTTEHGLMGLCWFLTMLGLRSGQLAPCLKGM